MRKLAQSTDRLFHNHTVLRGGAMGHATASRKPSGVAAGDETRRCLEWLHDLRLVA